MTTSSASAPDLLGEGAPRPPAVLPYAPRAGWAGATRAHRVLAVLCPVLLLAWVVVAALPSGTVRAAAGGVSAWNGLYLLVGPFAFFAAARVLRPYSTGVEAERVLRHGCAALATAYGSVLVVLMVLPSGGDLADDTGWLMVVLCVVLGPVTVVWGCVAALVRAVADVRAVEAAR